jgi:hypothetical protein
MNPTNRHSPVQRIASIIKAKYDNADCEFSVADILSDLRLYCDFMSYSFAELDKAGRSIYLAKLGGL